MYTIESESKYHLKLEEIKSIEDAGDDFMTADEVKEVLGLGDADYISTYSPLVRRQVVIDELSVLKADMKAKNKKSMIITDVDLVAFFHLGYAVSDFVPGLRRTGNRLSLHEKAERTIAQRNDAIALIGVGTRVINKKLKVNMDLKYVTDNYSGAIQVIQSLITWDEIESFIVAEYNTYLLDKKAFMKQVWDEPNMFQVV
jgi:hypothetical protein